MVTLEQSCDIATEGRPSFCEQKEAKKLYDFRPCWFHRLRPKVEEVFAPLFSKKRLLSFYKGLHQKQETPA
jgi:hypothetical protein